MLVMMLEFVPSTNLLDQKVSENLQRAFNELKVARCKSEWAASHICKFVFEAIVCMTSLYVVNRFIMRSSKIATE